MLDFDHDTFDFRSSIFLSPVNLADKEVHFLVLVGIQHVRLLRSMSFEEIAESGKIYLKIRLGVSNEEILLSK